MSASGGDVTQATVLDTTAGETSHRSPRFLPDGDHFLYTALPAAEKGFVIHVGSLKSGKSELLVHLPQGGAEYAAPGYILYSREGKLVARAFDAGSRKLAAETIVLADAVALSNTSGHSIVSAARTGRLAWLPVALTNTRLEWVDRAGRARDRSRRPRAATSSWPWRGDGKRALVSRYRASGEIEIYAYDPSGARCSASRLPARRAMRPCGRRTASRSTCAPVAPGATRSPGSRSPSGASR